MYSGSVKLRLWLVTALPAVLCLLFVIYEWKFSGHPQSWTIMAGLGALVLALNVLAAISIHKICNAINKTVEAIDKIAAGECVSLDMKGCNTVEFKKMAQAANMLAECMGSKETIEGKARQAVEEQARLAQERSEKQEKLNVFIGKNLRNIECLASSTEEMTASIGEIGSQIDRAVSLIDQTRTLSESSTGKVQGLGELTRKIDTVVEMIREIAEKTNLLALNATIEAARAGEAGRGFSVVAGEVKLLSSQTTEATVSINAQVNEIQAESADVVRLMEEINNSISGVFEVSSAINAAISQQGVAANEISHNANKIAEFSRHLKQDIEELATAS